MAGIDERRSSSAGLPQISTYSSETTPVNSPITSPFKMHPRSPSPEDIIPLWKQAQTPRLR